MRIYLLNPPFKKNFVRCGRWQGVAARGGTLYYPIWLAYATGLLEKEGHIVRLIDAIARKWKTGQVIADVEQFHPEIIVVDTNFSSIKNDIEIANALKSRTGAITIIVGPPASQFAEEILNQGIDIVARFEYDLTLRELVSLKEKIKDLASIKGISYMQDGKIIHNSPREFSTQKNLDEIPFVSQVYKKHLNPRDYFLNHAFYPMVQIITSRGCPNQCTFCSWPETLTGRKYRMRSVDNIVAEFEYISKELPEIKEIFIEDDCFTINKPHVIEFCSKIKEKGIRINWGCQARATLDYETMVAMKGAGCRLLDVGYESGSNEILKNIRKGITVDQLREFTKNAKLAKLKILADFVIGFPGETKETVGQTLKFIHEISPDLLQIAVATPMPGTDFYRICKENNYLLTSDMMDSLDKDGFQKCIISYPGLTNMDIEKFVNRGLKEYYLNPSYAIITMKAIIGKNGIEELKNIIRSLDVFFKYLIKKES
ncbi:MAG: B12-binding domain-containing radical SAM protein [Methanoregula sp.]